MNTKNTQTLRVALAQVNTTVGDFPGNVARMAAYAARAHQLAADIVVFPELALCGYPPEDLVFKPYFIRSNMAAVQKLARLCRKIAVIAGCLDCDDAGRVYNAAAVLQSGQMRGMYRKMCLPNYGVFDEQRHFSPGRVVPLITAGHARIGVSICEDAWVAGGIAAAQARAGAQCLLNISASPYHAGKYSQRLDVMRQRVAETRLPLAYLNLVGGQDELVFDGGSFVCDASGQLNAQAAQFKEELLCADIPLAGGRTPRRGGTRIRLDIIPAREKPAVPPHRVPLLPRAAEIYQALVLGTRDYVRKNGFKKVVLGISGGIDSALVAVIAADAVGPENVVAVCLPSRYSSAGTRRDAVLVARNLGVELKTVPIHDIVQAYMRVFHRIFAGCAPDITEENIQARIRGNLLMAFSNKFGWLVVTTGNKSETSVGYCTLYGDMAGGFAVIKDVPKTLVYELARLRNQQARPVIPESVFTRPPTAELKPHQTDQDSLPPYAVVDAIIHQYVEQDKSFEDICRALRVRRAVIKDVLRKIDGNEYKRRQSPPGIKITPKAFGRDRRMPITNKYRQFV
ncbi:MAG: NAD+ synthase [Candidatus Omnitrophica bacterium]|nr:NAD+ synthase [Candidatus Omnitrophota bacterium]